MLKYFDDVNEIGNHFKSSFFVNQLSKLVLANIWWYTVNSDKAKSAQILSTIICKDVDSAFFTFLQYNII